MSQQKEQKKPKQYHEKHEKGEKHDNVINMPVKCKSEGCTKRSEKAEFCAEHFIWFKEGLLTKEGKKPVDFERKLYYFNRRQAA